MVESNFDAIQSALDCQIWDSTEVESTPPVINVRHSHWGCGWVEFILVRIDASDETLTKAGEIVCALADYPVLDEEDYSNRQWDAILDYWESLDEDERMELNENENSLTLEDCAYEKLSQDFY